MNTQEMFSLRGRRALITGSAQGLGLRFAGVVIGGTSMFGGIGGVGKTVLGVLIYESIFAGLIYLHYDAFWQQVATGVVLILAVWIDHTQRRASASRRTGVNIAKKRSLWSRVGIGS